MGLDCRQAAPDGLLGVEVAAALGDVRQAAVGGLVVGGKVHGLAIGLLRFRQVAEGHFGMGDAGPYLGVLAPQIEEFPGRGPGFGPALLPEQDPHQAKAAAQGLAVEAAHLPVGLVRQGVVAAGFGGGPQPEPGFTVVRVGPGPCPGRGEEVLPPLVAGQGVDLVPQPAALPVLVVAGGDFVQPLGRSGKIHILAVAPAVVDDPQELPGAIEQSAALGPRGNGGGELDVFLVAQTANARDQALGDAQTQAQAVGDGIDPFPDDGRGLPAADAGRGCAVGLDHAQVAPRVLQDALRREGAAAGDNDGPLHVGDHVAGGGVAMAAKNQGAGLAGSLLGGAAEFDHHHLVLDGLEQGARRQRRRRSGRGQSEGAEQAKDELERRGMAAMERGHGRPGVGLAAHHTGDRRIPAE